MALQELCGCRNDSCSLPLHLLALQLLQLALVHAQPPVVMVLLLLL
jgi:hypothetical protein